METLYKLANHLLFLDDEKAAINYIKSDESESIIFESVDRRLFEICCYDTLYGNSDFVVEKKQYSENGEIVVITYSSKDRKLVLKEYWSSYKSGLLEKRVTIKLRHAGKISNIIFFLPEIKKTKGVEMELIAPFTPYFCLTGKEKEVDLNEFDQKNRGFILINSKIKSESCLIWSDNKSGNVNYRENRVLFEKIEEIAVDNREEIDIGRVFFSFYSGSYIENLENCSGYLEKSGYKSENSKKNLLKKVMDSYKRGIINSRALFRWIDILKIIGKDGSFLKEELSEKLEIEFYDIAGVTKFKEFTFSEEYREIIERGRVIHQSGNICNEKSVLGFIKKLRGSFLLVIFNFSSLSKSVEIKLEQEFESENIKFNHYFLKERETGKVAGSYIKGETSEINIGGNSLKILKFEPVLLKEEEGDSFVLSSSETECLIKNSFYELNFTQEECGIKAMFVNGAEKSIISGSKIKVESDSNGVLEGMSRDKFEMKCSKNKIIFNSDGVSVGYAVSSKNSIILKLDNIGKNLKLEFDINGMDRIIRDNKIEEEVVVDEFSELLYTGKNGIKFEQIKRGSLTQTEIKNNRIIFNFENSSSKKKSSEIKITVV